jgi:perosamine synthetase
MYKKIGLHEPSIDNNEILLAKNCIKSTWLSTSGNLINKFENKTSKFTKAKYCIALNSGTSALHISLILADVKANDEVLVPSLTFIAPVNCIRYLNANPVFMDCDETFNLDVEKTIEFIKKETSYKNNFSYNIKTKKKISAIIVVHVWGNAVKLDLLVNLCKRRNIKIIEDSSESLGTFFKEGKYKNKHTGTCGFCGVLSFNGNKIITSGNGGMILTNSNKVAKRAKYLSTQSKNNPFKYIHNEVGYNYRLSNLNASIGLSQIDKIKNLLISKKKIHIYYLKEISKIKGLKLLKNPKHSNSNNWLNIITIEKNYKYSINYLIKKFNKTNIEVRPVWSANHLQKHLKKFQGYKISKTNNLIKKSLCLPSSSFLSKKNLDIIINCLK